MEDTNEVKETSKAAGREASEVKRVVRHELDSFLDEAVERAMSGACEGSCDVHEGNVAVFRVFDKNSGFDWGYFSYCEAAKTEDETNRGMSLEHV